MDNEKQSLVVRAEMLIRRPISEVFEAFVDPSITTKFWFTKSSGRLEKGKLIRWDWEMYGVGDEFVVRKLETDRQIMIEWSDGTTTEWEFTRRTEQETFVVIQNAGFKGSADEVTAQAIDSMGGYTMVLCGLKAYLEHGIQLNLVGDKAPDAHVKS
jgi:uncharacterized protein YndB with AHSA1/START domain